LLPCCSLVRTVCLDSLIIACLRISVYLVLLLLIVVSQMLRVRHLQATTVLRVILSRDSIKALHQMLLSH